MCRKSMKISVSAYERNGRVYFSAALDKAENGAYNQLCKRLHDIRKGEADEHGGYDS